MSPDEFKRIREKLKLSQKDLAFTLSVSPKTVSRYEAGKTSVPRCIGEILKSKELRENNRLRMNIKPVALERIINSYDECKAAIVDFGGDEDIRLILARNDDEVFIYHNSSTWDSHGYIFGDSSFSGYNSLENESIIKIIRNEFKLNHDGVKIIIQGDESENVIHDSHMEFAIDEDGDDAFEYTEKFEDGTEKTTYIKAGNLNPFETK